MKEKGKGIYLILIGILLLGIDIGINTGISYGFEFGVNEGVKKGMTTYFLEAMIGENFKFDIFFNPVGYILVFVGTAFVQISKKYRTNIYAASVIGFLINVIKTALPFLVSQYSLLLPVILCTLAEIGMIVILLYSFTLATKKQVDNFNNMEVGKDLTFGVELYAFATVTGYIILPFAALYFYFARGAYVISLIAAWAAVGYFVYKSFYYTRQLGLFGTSIKDEKDKDK